MDRLEDPRARLAEGRRRREADSAGGDRRDVGEDVAERVLGEQDVEAAGIADELHRRIVDEHVVERDVGVVEGHGVDDLPPERRRLEHAVLVGDGDLAPALPGELERAARDPLDLARVVLARVEGRAVRAPSLLAVVEAAGELADDEDVDALGANRPEVREDAELLAETEQALLRADGCALELRRAHGGEQHRVGGAAGGERIRRERVARLADPGTAEGPLARGRAGAAARAGPESPLP